MHIYLLPSDYAFQVREEIKQVLKTSGSTSMQRAEQAAISQMRSYLNNRYDTNQVFPRLQAFKEGSTYNQGAEYVYFPTNPLDENTKLYTCLQDTQGQDPTEPIYWQEEDERNALIVMYAIDITLYHLYAAQARVKMPEHRADRYDEAMDWLKAIASGEIDADLPPLVSEEEGEESTSTFIRFGSHQREWHRF